MPIRSESEKSLCHFDKLSRFKLHVPFSGISAVQSAVGRLACREGDRCVAIKDVIK